MKRFPDWRGFLYRAKARKQFFFEKKNQKTFASAVARSPEKTATADAKAFCFFFSN